MTCIRSYLFNRKSASYCGFKSTIVSVKEHPPTPSTLLYPSCRYAPALVVLISTSEQRALRLKKRKEVKHMHFGAIWVSFWVHGTMQNGAPLRVPAAGIGKCAMVVLVAYNWSLNDIFRYAVADAHSHDF